MRLSADGLHVLSSAEGVYLDGALVAQNASPGDLFASSLRFYGGFNTPQVGLYAANLSQPFTPTWLGDFNVGLVTGFWTDGISRWLGNYTDGSRDSDGHYWPDRTALGSSRQGDWVFVDKGTFSQLIIRSSVGIERLIQAGAGVNDGFGGIDHGGICYQLPGGVPQLQWLSGPPVPVNMPNATPITVANGLVWGAGYQPGFGLCLARLDQAPTGYWLATTPNQVDFNPAIQARTDGTLAIATGANAGEFPQRLYVFNPATGGCTINGVAFTPPVVNINQPPAPPYTVPPFTQPCYVGVFTPVAP